MGDRLGIHSAVDIFKNIIRKSAYFVEAASSYLWTPDRSRDLSVHFPEVSGLQRTRRARLKFGKYIADSVDVQGDRVRVPE